MSKKLFKNIEAKLKPSAIVILMIVAALSTIFIATNRFENTAEAGTTYTPLDYTTFTEVDGGSDITVVNASHIDAISLYSNVETYVYKDYGVGGISGTFEYQVEVKWNSGSGKHTAICFWAVSDFLDDIYELVYIQNDKTIGLFFWQNDVAPVYRMSLVSEDGLGESADSYYCSLDTWYYITVRRGTANVTADIYTNKDRTVASKIDSLTVDYVSDSYQYLYALTSWNNGQPVYGDWDLQNLRIAIVAEAPSEFTLNGLTENRFIFSGVAGSTVWSNQTGDTVEINMSVNSTDNVTGIKIWIGNSNTTSVPYKYVNASNYSLYISSDDSSYGLLGTYPNGGGNLSINTSNWNAGTMGANPFLGAGIKNKDDSIWLRIKCTIPAAATVDTYYGVDCKVYIGHY